MRQLVWWGLTLGWMGGIWWLSDQPSLSSGLESDWWLRKGAHMLEYAILTWLWWRTLGRRYLILALGITIAYAISDEWHQTFVSGRHGSWLDVLIDSAGAGLMGGLLGGFFNNCLERLRVFNR
jgi:VanZ family protein